MTEETTSVKKKSKWVAIITGIVVFAAVITFIWSPIFTKDKSSIVLDEPPFGLKLPDVVIDDENSFEKGFLEEVPETWEYGMTYAMTY